MRIINFFIACMAIISCNTPNHNNPNLFPLSNQQPTYEQKVRSVEEEENANPLRFLEVEVNYKPNFWGDKLKLDGKITNTATVANYKDVAVEIVFYTKTKTRISSKKITFYEYVNAGKSISFFKKIDSPSNCHRITAEVISAIPY